MDRREFVASLVAGGCAGMCVDLTLFPLDTIKTRLQSQQGFYKAGGFRGIYAGVPSAAVGSFPNAAAFFVTYECTKSVLGAGGALAAPHVAPVTHMLAASLGEIVACLIRVPTEVVKQRTQASPSSSTYNMLLATLKEEGVRGLYRGYCSTVFREIPFSLVQFPLWEYLKTLWSLRQGHTLHSWQSAVCGAFAGAVAAFVTTPLDVAKTRIMLAKSVCRQPTTDGLHQRGRFHLPGSLREGPALSALAGRPLPPSPAVRRRFGAPICWRDCREGVPGSVAVGPHAAGPPRGA
ncbi:S-adenosylmethionine mitochondrial carrier protein isoform X1 [Kryptolebias marmoratus]|uniref:S-adenosylmethionine mitochondrial carrier protein isoform X1 n=1 Tax=Kryptolebias marmoratus TaxID=37003 RepID=UPI0018AC9B02|nr:S-adenosylmethionine mitochondrial carrier protein isoform X1 [Kryptolebias marmoratus]